MKKYLIVLAATTALALAGCTGQKARDHVLMPAMALAWPGVSADVQRGIDDAAADGDLTMVEAAQWDSTLVNFGAAVREGDRTQFAAEAGNWPAFRAFGDRGIADRVEDGEIGPGVAASFTERLDNFTEAVGTAITRLDG